MLHISLQQVNNDEYTGHILRAPLNLILQSTLTVIQTLKTHIFKTKKRRLKGRNAINWFEIDFLGSAMMVANNSKAMQCKQIKKKPTHTLSDMTGLIHH